MLNGLINGLDSVFMWLSTVLKQNFADYCDLETAQDEISLVAKDGSLISIVKMDGIKNLISGHTMYSQIIQPLNLGLQTHLEKKGHMLQFWFSIDPERTKQELENMIGAARETAKKLELDLDGMLDERVNNMSGWTSFEENYIVLWTRPTALSKSELKDAAQLQSEEYKKISTPLADGQDPFRANLFLIDRHRSFVESVVQELNKSSIAAEVMTVVDAARAIKKSIDPDFTGDNWEPFLPGDSIHPNTRKIYGKAEQWDIIWPKLNWQLCNRDVEIVDNNFVRIGDKVYAPLYIDLMPKETKTFDDLFGRLINKGTGGLPWRISYLLEGDGLSSLSTKQLFASILGFTSDRNKLMVESYRYLQQKNMEGNTVIKIRIALCTWVHKNEVKLLSKRVSDLARGVESWGSCLISEVTGDPISGAMSSALGATAYNIGTTSAAPLDEAIYMLPLTRPSSPWEKGAVLFRSPDGKIMPYQPGSSQQTTWISLIFAKPGSGKSVLMNMINLALCLAPGNERLPRIGTIDIGPSSSGLISLIKESLPQNKKHFAEYYRLQMTDKYCVNAFDTQLGCRFPTAEEKAFLNNLVLLLATDPNATNPEVAMTGLVNAVVEEMYFRCSDKQQPKTYDAHVDLRVDEGIKKLGMKIDDRTTWWEVVDNLFTNGLIHEATLAQRYAVPVLSDATAAAQEEKIRNKYEKVVISTSETLVNSFNRMITDSLSLYRILAKPTVFDIGDARIISLDLDEVAKTGGVMADRQTAVMYMLARYIIGKNYKLAMESLDEMPYPVHVECPKEIPSKEYKLYHAKRIEEIREDLKIICLDEFHRTSKSREVREQVIVDMREGRKWKIVVTLASQALSDFDSTMLSFATSIFIMDGGNEQDIDEITKVFGMSDEAERFALKNRVHGPRRGGGTFLAKFATNKGWYSQLLTSTLGPVELWAFSTTVEDVAIRNRLYKESGPAKARKMLSLAFPSGSAVDEVNYRKEKSRASGILQEEETNLYEEIVKEIIKKYSDRV